MNEVIDLFTELIDEDTVNNILQVFKEKVPRKQPSLEQKKRWVNNIFKKKTPQMIRETKKGNSREPFLFYIQDYNEPRFENLSVEEVFFELSEYKSKYVPSHTKLAIAFLNQPQALKKRLPLIKENYEKGRPLFSRYDFSTEEKIKKIINIGYLYKGQSSLTKMIDRAELFIGTNCQDILVEIEKKIKNLTIEEFFLQKEGALGKEYPDFLLLYVFLKNNEIKDENLRLGLYLKMINRIAEEIKDSLISAQKRLKEDKEDLQEKIKEIIDVEIENLQERFVEDIKKNEKKAKDFQDKYNIVQKDCYRLQKRLDKIKIRCQKEKEIVASLKSKNEKQNNDLNKLKKELAQSEQDKDKLVNKLEKVKDKVINIESLDIWREEKVPFIIIYTIDTNLMDFIYPEVPSIPYEQWKSRKNEIRKSKVKKLYIQRDALSSSQINEIQDFAKRINVEQETFLCHNEKELIELTAYYKHRKRG